MLKFSDSKMANGKNIGKKGSFSHNADHNVAMVM